jgi:hypothetical protein
MSLMFDSLRYALMFRIQKNRCDIQISIRLHEDKKQKKCSESQNLNDYQTWCARGSSDSYIELTNHKLCIDGFRLVVRRQ